MKGKFILSIVNLENLLMREIKPKHSDIIISVKQSEQSNSLYISLKYKGVRSQIRISDHPINWKGKALIIKKSTTNDHVIRFIENRITSLKIKKVNKLINNLP